MKAEGSKSMEKRKRIGRGAILILLAAAVAVSMAACGKSKGGKDNNKKESGGAESGEYVWVPQFVELDAEEVGYMEMQAFGDSMYCIVSNWDFETQKSSYVLREISLADGSVKSELPLRTGTAEDENRGPNRFAIDGGGNIWTWENIYHWNESTGNGTQENFLCKYDGSGNRVLEKDFTREMGEDSYVQGLFLDGEGRIYITTGSSDIYLFDSEGVYKGKISGGNDMYISSLGTDRDGVMYAVVNEYGAGRNGTSLKEIDFAQKSFGKSYANYPNDYSSGQIVPGVEKTALAHDGVHVYEYDKDSQSSENIFNWLDCDINGDHVRTMAVLKDGRIAVVTRDWESNRSELVLLSRTKASEVVRRVTITIGCLYENSGLQGAAVKFNKANDKYKISIKSYYDYNQVTGNNYQQVMTDALTRLNNDITSNNCPDILDLSQLNMAQLAAKGVLEDMNPYLEKSSVLSREDFLENILENFSYQGKLLTIPRSFELMTVAGKTSEVGAKPGWTLDEMLAYADKHPKAAVFDYSTKSNIIEFLVAYNQSAFVNWETGTCGFESDTFKNLLKFAARFPDEYDWNSGDGRSTPTKIAEGDVLLNQTYLYNFESVQEVEGIFGEPVTFIGFPNNEGTSGCYMQTNGLLAITTKSAYKDGAWAFLESYLSAERNWNDFGLPATRKGLQDAREEATRVEYFLDENGEQVLDENGEPIVINNGGGSVTYEDGWSYTYHMTTEAEADKLMELIRTARPVSDSDLQITNIIIEEAEAFFKNQKSVDDVAAIIQSRVQVYVNENR